MRSATLLFIWVCLAVYVTFYRLFCKQSILSEHLISVMVGALLSVSVCNLYTFPYFMTGVEKKHHPFTKPRKDEHSRVKKNKKKSF